MIALNVFGPALKYRLDLLKYSSYDVRQYVHILTDKISYEKFYQEFHNDYNFVFVEDYMSKYELSLKHEIIPNVFNDEEDHFENSQSFYEKNNTWFSFDIHRFIFPYFISKGIKKFVIIDSDLILSNNLNTIIEFFDTQPEKIFYSPMLGGHLYDLESKENFWNNLEIEWLKNKIKFPTDVPNFDGWIRGFNFETIEDANLFFNLWNKSYLTLLDKKNHSIHKNGEGPLIWSNEWVFATCVYIFCNHFSYNYKNDIAINPGTVYLPNSKNKYFGIHCPRPEDNLFHKLSKYIDKNGVERYPSRGAWYDYSFDYDCKKTISCFIQRNKNELEKYYKNYVHNSLKINITDTHVLTKLNE